MERSQLHQTQQAPMCGCGCGRPGTCRRSYDRSRKRAQARGDWGPRRVSPDRAREHVALLDAAGVNQFQIAKLAEVGASTLSRIVRGERPRISAEVEAAILSVEIPERASDITAPNALVPVLGARRRTQALVANGHPPVDLARRLDIHSGGHTMSALLGRADHNGHIAEYIHADRDQQVKDLFDELDMVPGRSDQARAYAAERGWSRSLAWDLDELDDRDAEPKPIDRSNGSEWHGKKADRVERDAAIVALLRTHSAAETAEVFGISSRQVERISAKARQVETEAEEVRPESVEPLELTEAI